MVITTTIRSLAETLKVEQADVAGLVKFLVAVKLAKVVGEKKGKGKPANVYEIPKILNIEMPEMAGI